MIATCVFGRVRWSRAALICVLALSAGCQSSLVPTTHWSAAAEEKKFLERVKKDPFPSANQAGVLPSGNR